MPQKGDDPKASNLNLTITRGRLSEQVAQQIQARIISGELKPGQQLLPERQLTEQLGVSRIVIREAMKALEQRGLVKVMTGSGTYVSKVGPEAISESIGLFVQRLACSLADLNEVRRLLEIEIAGLAAERAKPENIEAMEETLQDMKAVLANSKGDSDWLEKFVEADLVFHNALAQATQNSLLSVLLAPIADLMLEFRRVGSSAPGGPEHSLSYHRKILERVQARDVVGCRETMREHLAQAERLVALAQMASRSP